MSMFKLMGVWFVICAVLGIGMLGFVVWVIIKVMAHFGIIGG